MYTFTTAGAPLFELLDKYKIEYVLFSVKKSLTYVFDHSAGWRTIYEDQVVKL